MTESDLEIIRRVAKIFGFFIREANPENVETFAVHNDVNIYRSNFVWFEDEGFDAFFKQIYEFGKDSAPTGWY